MTNVIGFTSFILLHVPPNGAPTSAANGANSYGPDDCLNESRWIAAAALLTAADQVFTKQRLHTLASKGGEPYVLMTWAKDQFEAIAAELES
ncbi:MAG: hypothetical protein EBR82_58085 [Caulobacteraceae bacterium]|nr:hypothetical protein [Caulobacteraceae bacterium]